MHVDIYYLPQARRQFFCRHIFWFNAYSVSILISCAICKWKWYRVDKFGCFIVLIADVIQQALLGQSSEISNIGICKK